MKKRFLAMLLGISLVMSSVMPAMADEISVSETESVQDEQQETSENAEDETTADEDTVDENTEEAETDEIKETAVPSADDSAVQEKSEAGETENKEIEESSDEITVNEDAENPMTKFAVWWWNDDGGRAYVSKQQTENTTLEISMRSYEPEDADNTELTVSSSDEAIAVVNGYSFTFVSAGNVTITISAKDDPNVKIEVPFTVTHDPDEGTVLKEASCSEVGQIQHTCQQCGTVYTEEIEKLPHTYVYENASGEDNIAKKTCTVCGVEETFTTMTEFYLWWWEGYKGSGGISATQTIGDSYSVSLRSFAPKDADNTDLELVTSDENVATVSGTSFTFVGDGTVTITIQAKYNPSVKIEKTFTVPPVITEGTCGENLTWTYDSDTGELCVSGTGAMYDYSDDEAAPWYPLRKEIKSVKISEGVTGIGTSAFDSCIALESAVLPDSVIIIDSYAFYGCSELSSMLMGAGIREIGNYVFYECSSDLVIKGWSETAAQTYAEENDISFEEIEHTHDMTKIDAKNATCTEDGNSEYWYCSICKRYFSDEEGTQRITKNSWVLQSYGHDYENGVCKNCGKTTEEFQEKQQCETYTGSNQVSEYFSAYGSTVKSYLQATGENETMRFQVGAVSGKYLAEYYDASNNFVRAVKIDWELPTFGAYYYDGTYHYVLSGQSNTEEDNSKEVYRITKYDKDWNRISSAGLYGANTVYPFASGSARITNDGKDMFIRTCHKMYTTSDGLNHQANVTIQVDTDKMKIVDSYYEISNSGYGYVSHSFDQFIRLDDGQIVGVDLGDAYPRGVVLLKYDSLYSDSGFAKECSGATMLPISGDTGDNATGVSIGGFEISDNNYIVVGNAVSMDENYDPEGTRNIFVSVVDKSLDNDPQIKYLTDYAEGESSPSKPQFVKISNNRFVVLWKKDGVVNYCEIDGNGDLIGEIMTMEGNLSDAVPQIINNRIVWYVWKNETNTFYSIDINDLAASSSQVITNGHSYDVTYPSDGENTATRTCKDCGLTETLTTLTDFSLWWYKGWAGSSYISSEQTENAEYSVSLRDQTPEEVDNDELEVLSSDSSVAVADGDTFKFVGVGTVTITVCAKYNPSVKIEKTFTVSHDPDEGTVLKEATCSEEGQIRHVCQQCGKEYTETIEKLPHTYQYENASGSQNTAKKICTVCGETETFTTLTGFSLWWWTGWSGSSYISLDQTENVEYSVSLRDQTPEEVDNDELEVLSSDSSVAVADGDTFKFVGVGTVTITVRAKYNPSVKIEKTFTVSHDPDEGTILKEATCSEEGQIRYVCQQCGKEYTEPIEKLPHTYQYENASGSQNTAKKICTVCGETETLTTLTDFSLWWYKGWAGSSYINSEQTENAEYSVSLRDQTPEEVDNDELEVLSSDSSVAVVDGDTFKFVGVGTVTITVRAKYNPSVKIEKTFTVSHDPDEGTILKEATCSEEGQIRHVCQQCGKEYTETIEKLPHTYQYENASGSQNTAKKICTVCGETETFTTLTGFSLWWWTGWSGSSYISLDQTENVEYSVSLRDQTPEEVDNDELEVLSSDSSVAVADGDTFKFVGVGTVTITVRAKYNPSVKVEKTFTVSHVLGTAKTVKAATYISTGQKQAICSVCGKIITTTIPKLTQISLSKCNASLSYSLKTYTGKALAPAVSVKYGTKTVDPKCYTVTYSNNKYVGKATVKITAKTGNIPYTGSITKTFTINPKGTSLVSLTAASKGFTVKWKKQATQTTGYEIQYSLSSKFSSPKTVTISGTSTVLRKITKLSAKKKYYVRIRTYKIVSKVKYYSSWSVAKYVTTKA